MSFLDRQGRLTPRSLLFRPFPSPGKDSNPQPTLNCLRRIDYMTATMRELKSLQHDLDYSVHTSVGITPIKYNFWTALCITGQATPNVIRAGPGARTLCTNVLYRF